MQMFYCIFNILFPKLRQHQNTKSVIHLKSCIRFDFVSLHTTKKKRAMNNGKTIFSQIMSNIPEREFKACVDRYKGNYRSRNFTCKDQFLVMSYAQLTNRGSLRDIENCLTALSSRLYHCGISYAVPRMLLTAVPSAFVLSFALGLSFASIKEVSRCIHY